LLLIYFCYIQPYAFSKASKFMSTSEREVSCFGYNAWMLLEIHCHLVVVFILILLYGALACFVLMGAFIENGNNWVAEQRQCFNRTVPLTTNCTLEEFVLEVVTSSNQMRYHWLAFSPQFPNLTLYLFPDCRFLIRNDYVGTPSQLIGANYTANSTVPCHLASNFSSTLNGSIILGTLSNVVWNSNLAELGFQVTLALAICCIALFGLFFTLALIFCEPARKQCWIREREDTEICENCCKHWFSPKSFLFTLNPLICLKFCVPLWDLWKLIWNIIVVAAVIIAIILAIFLDGQTCYNYNYNC